MYVSTTASTTQALITPHGDLNRGYTASAFVDDSNAHYPSWGFETSPPRRSNCAGEVLITPHGDLKPGFRFQVGEVLRDSLPLMGI